MKRALLLLLPVLALVSSCTTPSPLDTPTQLPPSPPPTDTPVPSPTPTEVPTPTSTATATNTYTPEPTRTPTFVPTPTIPPSPTPQPQLYVVVERIDSFDSPDAASPRGYIARGKTFFILGEEDGWLHIRLTEGAEPWIHASETAYLPEGQTPPGPIACRIPHWPNRTPDRKTGYRISFGEYRPTLYDPDTSPYAPHYNGAYWRRFHIPPYDRNWIYVRDARIVSIDRESAVIEFYIGSGLSVPRRFTAHTDVLMAAHEVYVGMPSTESTLRGGNLCDLEVGDMVNILHPTLGEAQFVDPNLIDLWGVLIVQ